MRVKSLKILGMRFPITYKPKTAKIMNGTGKEVGSHHLGLCWPFKGKIFVMDSLATDSIREVILHESIHILSDYLRIGLKESQVEKLSVGLNAFLADNQKFTKEFLK